MSKRIAFAPLAAAIGLGFSLLAGSLVAPSSARAEGEIRIAEQFGIVYLLLNVVRDQQLIEKHGKQEASTSRSTGPSCPAARQSTMRYSRAPSTLPAPGSGHC
jgi:ABC-type nitrate/sulfonate/bicarbonate transport system substrate-binding protein